MWFKILPYLAAVVLAGSIYTVGHVKGAATCEIKSAKKEAGIAAKGNLNHAESEKKVMQLSVTHLDRDLGQFLYD